MKLMADGRLGFLARSIRGLEWVAASEIRGRLGAKITALGHREIHFELLALAPDLVKLSSVDDVFLNCGSIGNLDHTRASLRIFHWRGRVQPLRHLCR